MIQAGDKFGQYKLIRMIGKGGFAEVWLGKHEIMEVEAAIKILNLALPTPEERDKFLDEARHLGRLSHPNIVRILECGMESDIPFLVLEYAPNDTLRARHPRGTRLPADVIAGYVRQIADGLQYAHNRRLIHRDVKPENMLLGKTNQVLVSDFGISAIENTASFLKSQQQQQYIFGTLGYMAPEQMDGNPTAASDQYALAVVVYEWLCGQLPFKGSADEIRTQQRTKVLQLQDKVSGISPALEQVVLKALSEDLHQRYRDMEAFADALEQAVGPNGPIKQAQPDPANVNASPGAGGYVAPNNPSPNPVKSPLPPNAAGGSPFIGINPHAFNPNIGAQPLGENNANAGASPWGENKANAGGWSPAGNKANAGAPSPGEKNVNNVNAGAWTPPGGWSPGGDKANAGAAPLGGNNANAGAPPFGGNNINAGAWTPPGGWPPGGNNANANNANAGFGGNNANMGGSPPGRNPNDPFYRDPTILNPIQQQYEQGATPFDPAYVAPAAQSYKTKRRSKLFDRRSIFGGKNRLFVIGGGIIDFGLAVALAVWLNTVWPNNSVEAWNLWLGSVIASWVMRAICAGAGRRYLAILPALALVFYWFIGSWAWATAFNMITRINVIPPHIVAILLGVAGLLVHVLYVNKKK